MNTALTSTTTAEQEFFLEQRLLVLRVFRLLMPAALPIYALTTLPGWFAGEPSLVKTTEASLFTLITLVIWLLRDKHVEWSVGLWHAGFLMVTLFSLLNNGPSLGVGMMFLAWSLSMVFFYDTFRLPPVIFSIAFCSLGYLFSEGVVGVEWVYPGHQRWLQMALSGVLLILSCDYLIMRLLNRTRTTLLEKLDAQITLAKGQRLESVGRLAGGAAHDFNNALMVIIGSAELLKDEKDPVQRNALIAQIDRAAEGAQATTQQLISFSSQRSEPGGRCQPAVCLREVAASMERLLPERLKVLTELEVGPDVPISRGQLQQVLLNLCLNARDAMPSTGTLTLSLRYSGDHAYISVVDTGEGIPEHLQANIFEPFFTTRPGLGSGLGLTMAKNAMEEAGGAIEVKSSANEGTRFTLSLPVLERPAHKRSVSQTVESGAVARERKILLLEDEPSVRATLSLILDRAGYQVVEVETVQQSLDATLDDISLVLSDAVLPDGNPRALIEKCHQEGVPVIVCSGYVKDDVLDQEVSGFLQKPVSREFLLREIGRVLKLAA